MPTNDFPASEHDPIQPLPPDAEREREEDDDETDEAVRVVIERILPDQECRATILALLGESIDAAHAFGADRWAVTYTRSHVRLHVGRYNLLEVGKNYLWLAFDASILPAKSLPCLQLLHIWRRPRFAAYPASAAGAIACAELDEVLPLVRDAYLALLRKEAQGYRVGSAIQARHTNGREKIFLIA